MKIFVILSAVLAVALCRPDGLSGYQYQVPQTSYGVPSYSLDQSAHQTSYQSGSSLSGASFQVQPSIPLHASSYQSTVDNVQTGFGFSGQSNDKPFNVDYQQSGSGYQQSNAGYAQGGFYQGGSGFQSSVSSPAVKTSYVQLKQSQPTQIFKHFYVHSAPEEPEVPRVRHIPPPPAAQKHYKVIFVKAPSAPASHTTIVQYPPQVEEKTLVYVLSKKNDEKHEVVIPKVEQKPAAKPEVFFIKYDKEHNTEGVISNIVSNIKGDASQTVVQQPQEEYHSGSFTGGNSGSFTGGSSGSLIGGSSGSYTGANSDSFSSGQSDSSGITTTYLDTSNAVDQTSYKVQSLPHATYGVPTFREH